VIVKYLHSPIERIHHKHVIVVVDEHTRRQLELTERHTSLPKEVQQAAFAIENLHHPRKPVHNVQVIFLIHGNALGPEYLARRLADLAHRSLDTAVPAKPLDAEIHRVHHQQVVVVEV
jgi:hypothetical protein